MPDTQKYLEMLESSRVLREPTVRTIIGSMRIPDGGKGLDAGCGTGVYTLILAEAAGKTGHVTGLDIEDVFLETGRGLALGKGFEQRVSFVKGDIGRLGFEDDVFDWAFSMDLVGNIEKDPAALIGEMARVVRPGGAVYILNWSSQTLLAGYPVLEARLNATSMGAAPFAAGMKPERHNLRALAWMKQAGLRETQAKTFAGDITPPFGHGMRRALASLFEMRWGADNEELTAEDRLAYRRLCREDSPDFIADAPGYHGFFTYTLFWGRV